MINDIQIGPITIHMYGVMIAIGLCLAVTISSYRAKKCGLDEDTIYKILWNSVIGGFLGTRILYYITVFPSILKDPSILWDFASGYVVYGGIIGGIVANIIYFRIKKIPFLPYFDLVLPQVALAQAVGRLGCFFAGCCYGMETDLPIGITYTISKFAPNGVSIMPTQLFSSAGDLLIFIILLWYGKRAKKHGEVGALYLILYSAGRFGIEFLRNDERGSVGSLSTSQFIAIGLFFVGIALMVFCRKLSGNEKKTTIKE